MSKHKTIVMDEDWFGHEEAKKLEQDLDLIHGDQSFEELNDDIGTLSDYEYTDCNYCENDVQIPITSTIKSYECTPTCSIMESISLMACDDMAPKENLECKDEPDKIIQNEMFYSVPVVTHEAFLGREIDNVIVDYDSDNSSESIEVISFTDSELEGVENLSTENIADLLLKL